MLSAKGVMLKSGTVLDATLIAAPSSNKNSSGECGSEMKQSCKGQQLNFSTKCHIGVDVESGLVHTVKGTSGAVNDVIEAKKPGASQSPRGLRRRWISRRWQTA